MSRRPALVVHVAGSAGWAGGEAYLLKLAGALDRARFSLGVVVPESGPLVGRLEALGVPTVLVPLAERLVSPGVLLALARRLRRWRPAIVQSHGARSNVYTRLAARLAGVPVVLSTVHNSLFDYEVSPARRRAYVAAERWTSALADRVVAVSAAVARDLVQRYGLPAAKVVVVRNGIDADAFVPCRPPAAARAELGLGPGDRPIGLVARMTEQKAHVDLLDALPAVLARVPALACVLIGDGPLRAAIEARARALGVAGRCRFTGARADVAVNRFVIIVANNKAFDGGAADLQFADDDGVLYRQLLTPAYSLRVLTQFACNLYLNRAAAGNELAHLDSAYDAKNRVVHRPLSLVYDVLGSAPHQYRDGFRVLAVADEYHLFTRDFQLFHEPGIAYVLFCKLVYA